MKTLAEQMNDDAFCNSCRIETKTVEWDCVKCGFSKPFPKEWLKCPDCQSSSVHKSFPLGLPEGEYIVKCDDCNRGSNMIVNGSVSWSPYKPTHTVDRWKK